jgi:hypothetical protein
MALPNLVFFGRATVPYSQVPPLGGDGSCNEAFKNAVWAQTALDTNPSESGSFLATSCYDSAHRRVYLFGSTDSIAYSAAYDCNADTYTQIGDLPTASGQQTYAAAAAGKAWLFGGGAGVPFTTNSPTAGIQSYDLSQVPGSGTTYSTIAPVVSYSAYGLFGDYDPVTKLIYFGGGCDNIAGPPGPANCFNQWQSFDPFSPATPTALHVMPVKVAESACALLNGVIYVIGGSLDATPETVGTRGVYAYNIATNTWTTKNNFPIDIACGRACNWNGTLYCGGGWNASGFSFSVTNATQNIYAYNPLADSWSLHSQATFQAAGSILVGLNSPPSGLFFGAGTTS